MLTKIICVGLAVLIGVGLTSVIQDRLFKKISSELQVEIDHQKALAEEKAKDSDRTKQKTIWEQARY